VGRARHQASALSSSLRSLGAEVIEIPFIEIREPRSFAPLDRALKNISRYDWLILTSVNGVEAVWERMKVLRLTKRQLAHLKIAAIGPARATVITYVNPAVAVLLGVLLLDEHFTVGMAVGFPLILLGSVLAARKRTARGSAQVTPVAEPAPS